MSQADRSTTTSQAKLPPMAPGQKYGRLVALELTHLDEKGRACWRWRCDCGQECIKNASQVRCGNTRSCGCLGAELAASRWRTHGMSKTPEFSIWRGMLQRCTNQRNPKYAMYGGR